MAPKKGKKVVSSHKKGSRGVIKMKSVKKKGTISKEKACVALGDDDVVPSSQESSQGTSLASSQSTCDGSDKSQSVSKKNRGENWQHSELRLLLDWCKANVDVIEGEHNPKVTRQLRVAKWEEITTKINS
jgi:hypothetical protein